MDKTALAGRFGLKGDLYSFPGIKFNRVTDGCLSRDCVNASMGRLHGRQRTEMI